MGFFYTCFGTTKAIRGIPIIKNVNQEEKFKKKLIAWSNHRVAKA